MEGLLSNFPFPSLYLFIPLLSITQSAYSEIFTALQIKDSMSYLRAFVRICTLPRIYSHGHITNSNSSFKTFPGCHTLYCQVKWLRERECTLHPYGTNHTLGIYLHIYFSLKKDNNLLRFIAPVPSIMPDSY